MQQQGYSDSSGLGPELSYLPIHVWNDQGQFTPYSTEEIVAKRMNAYKGWQCTAGRTSLFIDFDGVITRGVCNVGGNFGNIYGKHYFPISDVVCDKLYCMCGADIMAPKYKTKALQGRLRIDGGLAPAKITDAIAVTGSELVRGQPVMKRVAWSLGRRCNYDCSYCSEMVHNKTEPYKTKEQLMAAAESIVDKFCRFEKTEFYIAGGEPTIQPGIVELVKYLHSKGHSVVLLSNGSHKPETYAELAKWGHLCLSAHFQFVKPEKFAESVRAAVRQLNWLERDGEPVQYHRVDVKLLTLPGGFAASEAMARRILSIDGFNKRGTLRFNPVWRPEATDKLYDYTPEETRKFAEFNSESYQWRVLRPGLMRRIMAPLARGRVSAAAAEARNFLSYSFCVARTQVRHAKMWLYLKKESAKLGLRLAYVRAQTRRHEAFEAFALRHPGLFRSYYRGRYMLRHPVAAVTGGYYGFLETHPRFRERYYFLRYALAATITKKPLQLIDKCPPVARAFYKTSYVARHPRSTVRGWYYGFLDSHPRLRDRYYFFRYAVRSAALKSLRLIGMGAGRS